MEAAWKRHSGRVSVELRTKRWEGARCAVGRRLQAGEQQVQEPWGRLTREAPGSPSYPASELPFHLHVEVLGLEDETESGPAPALGDRDRGPQWGAKRLASPCSFSGARDARQPLHHRWSRYRSTSCTAPGPGAHSFLKHWGWRWGGGQASQGRTLPRAPAANQR